MRIAQITDLHLDDFMNGHYDANVRQNLDRVLKDIKAREIKDIILTGDLCHPESFHVITDMIDSYQLSSLYLMGNHDDWNYYKDKRLFSSRGKEDGCYWFEKKGDNLYLYMDSRLHIIEDKQKEWLKLILKRETFQRVILFIHHPVLDCGGTTMDHLFPLKGREEIAEIFHETKKEVFLFCGHYHGAYEVQEKLIHQSVTPSLLVQLQEHSETTEQDTLDFAYRIIDITDSRVSSELILFKSPFS
jgi:Icc protein